MVGNLFLGRWRARYVKSCWRDWSDTITGKNPLGRVVVLGLGGDLVGGEMEGQKVLVLVENELERTRKEEFRGVKASLEQILVTVVRAQLYLYRA